MMSHDDRAGQELPSDPGAILQQLLAVREYLAERGCQFTADGLPILPAIGEGSRDGSLGRVSRGSRRGGVSAAREAALAQRDGLIVQLWRKVPAWRDQPPAAAARLMQTSAERYQAAQWRRERANALPPESEPAATWWKILKGDAPIPAHRQLKRILSKEKTPKK